MTQFSFATVNLEDGERAAVVLGGRYFRLDRVIPDLPAVGLRSLMERWDDLVERTSQLAAEPAAAASLEPAALPMPKVLAPLRFPNKLICVGGVYEDHLRQFKLPAERWPRMPIFLRPPTTSIVGPGPTVHVPKSTRQFDWEIELAVVLGRHVRHASEITVREAIAGYSIGIDFTCRDLLDRGSQMGVDLVRAKAQDDMAPLGPVIVPARFIANPQDLRLQLWVNGKLRQDGNTAQMLYSVTEQISTISQFITLEPGDVVFTGSPAGSAESDDEFLRPGDRIRAEIDRIGALELELLPPRNSRATGDS